MRKSLVIALLALLLAGCGRGSEQEVSETTTMLTEEQMITSTQEPTQEPIQEPTQETTEERTEMSETVVLLPDSIEYMPVEVDGITRVRCIDGKGAELDLNGDGVAEQVYTDKKGVYINGVLQNLDIDWNSRTSKYAPDHGIPCEYFHIVDVNVSDSYYNLVFSAVCDYEPIEILTCYSDGELKEIGRLCTSYSGSGRAFSTAEYYGDGTFLAHDILYDFLEIEYGGDQKYRLNEDNQLETIDTYAATPWAYDLELLEPITMYSEPDYNSEAIVVQPQTVYGLGLWKDWAKMRLENETEVWLHFTAVYREDDALYGEGMVRHFEGYMLDNGKYAYQEMFGNYPYME